MRGNWQQLAVRYRARARLARFYGFSPFTLTTEQVLGLLANMPALEAGDVRRELQYRPDVKLSPDQWYELIKAETGSEKLAQDAATEYAAALLRSMPTHHGDEV